MDLGIEKREGSLAGRTSVLRGAIEYRAAQ